MRLGLCLVLASALLASSSFAAKVKPISELTSFPENKTVKQQGIQAIHRIRSELIRHRNAKANQIRGLVAEYGLVAPRQLIALRRAVPDWLEDAQNGLSVLFRRLLNGL